MVVAIRLSTTAVTTAVPTVIPEVKTAVATPPVVLAGSGAMVASGGTMAQSTGVPSATGVAAQSRTVAVSIPVLPPIASVAGTATRLIVAGRPGVMMVTHLIPELTAPASASVQPLGGLAAVPATRVAVATPPTVVG